MRTMGAENAGNETLMRESLASENLCQRFTLPTKKYEVQFSHIYSNRLNALKPLVIATAYEKWPRDAPTKPRICSKIIELSASTSMVNGTRRPDVWIVAGCIYKEMKLKPSVLEQYSGNRNIDSIISLANYCSDDDTVFLEDDSGRVLLTEGKLRLQAMKNGKLVTKYVNFPFQQFIDTAVTGIIVAITGRVSEDGDLVVDDVTVPGLRSGAPTDVPRSLPAFPSTRTPVYVALMSDLRAGFPTNTKVIDPVTLLSKDAKTDPQSGIAARMHPIALSLLQQWITGHVGGEEKVTASRVARVIIAGGGVGTPAVPAGQQAQPAYRGPTFSANSFMDSTKGIIRADSFFTTLVKSVEVDVMPGTGEATTLSLPQKPLHSCLFPSATRFTSFRRAPNPYSFTVAQKKEGDTTGSEGVIPGAGIVFLGTSGSNVDNILQYSCNVKVQASGDETTLQQRFRNEVEEKESEGEGTLKEMDVDSTDASGGTSRKAKRDPLSLTMDVDHSSIAVIPGGEGDDEDTTAVIRKEDELLSVRESHTSPIDVLTNTLYWRHMAPTAPDTLSCYPFSELDPFVIDQVPDVYFAGGQTSYGSRLVTDHTGQRKVRVVSVPSFYETSTIVLVNINSPTYETFPISFSIGGKSVNALDYSRKMKSSEGLERMEVRKRDELLDGFGCRFKA